MAKRQTTVTKKETPAERALVKLRGLLDAACRLRGEAMWTNGYRAAMYGGHTSNVNDPDAERMYQKEMAQRRACDPAEKAVIRQARALARIVASGRAKRKR